MKVRILVSIAASIDETTLSSLYPYDSFPDSPSVLWNLLYAVRSTR